ncbi:MAG: ribosome biogenesis GTPase Der, partial [Planctomycetota bacterium]
DVRDGLLPLDEAVALKLRKTSKPIILVVNKADTAKLETEAVKFLELNLGEVVTTSAVEKSGKEELLKRIGEMLGEDSSASPDMPEVSFAVVGKRNVGKSTFINAISRRERVLVSSTPGTTRDAVEVPFYKGAKLLVVVDTAGIRKKGKLEDSVEFFSRCRVETAIKQADTVIFIIEAVAEISRVDKKLAQFILSEGKPCVVVINKWDLAEGVSTDEFAQYVRAHLPALWFAPIVFTSALKKEHVSEVVEVACSLVEQSKKRVPTAKLNKIVRDAVAKRSPGTRKGPIAKILYATQAETNTPTVVLFVNSPSLFSPRYLRYLENFFRNNLPFSEIPIRLKLRARERKIRQKRK